MRAAEVIAALSLATDLALGVERARAPEHTHRAPARRASRRGSTEAAETYYACLLLHVGCTADRPDSRPSSSATMTR